MNKEKLYDISEVCKKLGITSRALRFYEEKGIVHSTIDQFPSRRKYTQNQIEHIKKVLILRKLGLSINTISKFQEQNIDLKTALLLKRAEIGALIDAKQYEINLINEALAMIDNDKNILEYGFAESQSLNKIEYETIVSKCTDAIINGDTECFYSYLSETLKEYVPVDAYEKSRMDTLVPLGKFISIDKRVYDKKYSNIIYQYIKYENYGLKIKYVFYDGLIHGFWFEYCKI